MKPNPDRVCSQIESIEAQFGFEEILAGPNAVSVDPQDRLPRFHDVRLPVGEILSGLSIFLVGSGSIGMDIAERLARLGIKNLFIVDGGHFKDASLLTHSVLPDDIGKSKAWIVGARCKAISPQTRVFVYDSAFEELAEAAIADSDFVFLASDNLAVEVEAGRRCTAFQKPLLQASLAGEVLVAQVRTFGNNGGDAQACPACQYNDREWELLAHQTRYSCEGALNEDGAFISPSTRKKTRDAVPPTMSVSFLCSMAANLLLTGLFRHLFIKESIEDQVAEFAGFTLRSTVSPLYRNPECRCDHTIYERPELASPLHKTSGKELLLAAGSGVDPLALESASLTIAGYQWAETGTCGCSHQPSKIRRFVSPPLTAGPCVACGDIIHANPFATFDRVPVSNLADFLDRPLDELGAKGLDSVLLRVGENVFHFENPRTEFQK